MGRRCNTSGQTAANGSDCAQRLHVLGTELTFSSRHGLFGIGAIFGVGLRGLLVTKLANVAMSAMNSTAAIAPMTAARLVRRQKIPKPAPTAAPTAGIANRKRMYLRLLPKALRELLKVTTPAASAKQAVERKISRSPKRGRLSRANKSWIEERLFKWIAALWVP
jgi:hypothetical protein